jgi:hypothetical protein
LKFLYNSFPDNMLSGKVVTDFLFFIFKMSGFILLIKFDTRPIPTTCCRECFLFYYFNLYQLNKRCRFTTFADNIKRLFPTTCCREKSNRVFNPTAATECRLREKNIPPGDFGDFQRSPAISCVFYHQH